jgi:hypothetical protein
MEENKFSDLEAQLKSANSIIEKQKSDIESLTSYNSFLIDKKCELEKRIEAIHTISGSFLK